MNIYYLNLSKQYSNGCNYEIHKYSCNFCNPQKFNFVKLGLFNEDLGALHYARISYPQFAVDIDGCKYCCKSIHKE